MYENSNEMSWQAHMKKVLIVHPMETMSTETKSTLNGNYKFLPWQFLNFLPLPQGQGALGRGVCSAT